MSIYLFNSTILMSTVLAKVFAIHENQNKFMLVSWYNSTVIEKLIIIYFTILCNHSLEERNN